MVRIPFHRKHLMRVAAKKIFAARNLGELRKQLASRLRFGMYPA